MKGDVNELEVNGVKYVRVDSILTEGWNLELRRELFGCSMELRRLVLKVCVEYGLLADEVHRYRNGIHENTPNQDSKGE